MKAGYNIGDWWNNYNSRLTSNKSFVSINSNFSLRIPIPDNKRLTRFMDYCANGIVVTMVHSYDNEESYKYHGVCVDV